MKTILISLCIAAAGLLHTSCEDANSTESRANTIIERHEELRRVRAVLSLEVDERNKDKDFLTSFRKDAGENPDSVDESLISSTEAKIERRNKDIEVLVDRIAELER